MKRTILKVVAVLLALAVVFPAFAGGAKEPVNITIIGLFLFPKVLNFITLSPLYILSNDLSITSKIFSKASLLSLGKLDNIPFILSNISLCNIL